MDGHPENALTRDELLDNLMLYWLPTTGVSAARLYWESIEQIAEWISGAVGDITDVPTGGSMFPQEMQRLSRRWHNLRCSSRMFGRSSGWFAAPPSPMRLLLCRNFLGLGDP
ncbi:hypothetical protein ABZ942_32905 [Nocardia sp. NPDC046473]|uniref:hypothetical protein n=1 Tax=Nocardia sp. NPDC046473 TaxID=3155733 RepID=UPI0033E6D9DA